MVLQFISNNITIPLISSFFTVVGGALPIAILIFIFSLKEKKRLLLHAKELKKTLHIQEQLYQRMVELINKSIGAQNINQSLDQFKQLIEAQNIIDRDKKFIKYAENYNFISAIGNILRMGNYIPKSIDEHKEISKDIPNSPSS